jgi:ubiquinone/menaquinone biosynthesis C-methylase UbiE
MPTVTDNESVELGGITRAAIYDSFISKTDDLLAIEGFLARLAEKHSPPRFGRMLDVGCGTGRVLPIVARISEKVTGIDMNAEYLEQARGYARELQLTNVDLQHCDLSQWKEQEAFDLVSMINGVFYYFESGVALLP